MDGPGRSLELSQPLSPGPGTPTTVLASSAILFADGANSPPPPPPQLSLYRASRGGPRWWWWRWWHGKLSQQLLVLVLAVLSGVGLLLLCSAVQYRRRRGLFMLLVPLPPVDNLVTQLSPPLDVHQTPFLDLCLTAEVMEAHVRHGAGRPEKLRRRQLDADMDRYNHILAHGGNSAIQWGAMTGLPVAHRRWGEVRARFLTTASALGESVHIATTAATMAGVRLEVLGHRWRHFNFHKRMAVMLSYVKHERLSDADVIVGLDSDALMSGEDVFPFLEAFVASTAASETEHLSYSLRDIRLGRRMAPLVFSTETNCSRVQITADATVCGAPYRAIDAMMTRWAAEHNQTLPSDYADGRNPLRFFNAGVFVGRVWAVRLWNTAVQEFVHTHRPRHGRTWWCDQSSMATLYLELRQWELRSRALDGAPRELTAQEADDGVYPPLLLPVAERGPHRLPAGLVGLDGSGLLALTLSAAMSGHDIFRLDTQVVAYTNYSDAVLDRLLRGSARQLETSLTGVVRAGHRLRLTPRNGVDCQGVLQRGPECDYRDAVLGIPSDAAAVTPLMWHFVGPGKRRSMAHYRGIFPWYTPGIRDAAARNAVLWTLLNAPPTRVFVMDRQTDVVAISAPPALQPHAKANDLSFYQMCSYRFYQGW